MTRGHSGDRRMQRGHGDMERTRGSWWGQEGTWGHGGDQGMKRAPRD